MEEKLSTLINTALESATKQMKESVVGSKYSLNLTNIVNHLEKAHTIASMWEKNVEENSRKAQVEAEKQAAAAGSSVVAETSA